MKPIKISLGGLMEAFGLVLALAFGGLFLFVMGMIVWHEANTSWLWQGPLLIGGLLAFFGILAGLSWLHEKNPSITIGGKPKKYEFPKAKLR